MSNRSDAGVPSTLKSLFREIERLQKENGELKLALYSLLSDQIEQLMYHEDQLVYLLVEQMTDKIKEALGEK